MPRVDSGKLGMKMGDFYFHPFPLNCKYKKKKKVFLLGKKGGF